MHESEREQSVHRQTDDRQKDFFAVRSRVNFTLKPFEGRWLGQTLLGYPSPGAPNLTIHADLTLRGQTHPITFQATPGLTPEGKPAAQANLQIDRTRWGVLYGSGKFFHRHHLTIII